MSLCLVDIDDRSRLERIEELDDVVVAHADAAVRARLSHRLAVGRAMDVDAAHEGIHRAAAILAVLESTEPKDAAQDPVAPGLRRAHVGRADLAGGPTSNEHGP